MPEQPSLLDPYQQIAEMRHALGLARPIVAAVLAFNRGGPVHGFTYAQRKAAFDAIDAALKGANP